MAHRKEGAALILLYVLVVACSNSCSRTEENVDRDEACKEALNDRDDVLLFIDVDAGVASEGGADADAEPCVVDCPGSIPDAAFSDPALCQAQCMERAALERLEDPKFVGCRASPQLIACTIDILAPKPCDLITR